MCICVCAHVHAHPYVHGCTCVHTCECTRVHVWVCACALCDCMCMCVQWIRAHVHVHMCACERPHVSACTCVCTCTHEVAWTERGHGSTAGWRDSCGEVTEKPLGLVTSPEPLAPIPPSGMKHLRGCRPRPWPCPCKARGGRAGSLAGREEPRCFCYEEAYLHGFTVLWARRGPGEVRVGESGQSCTRLRSVRARGVVSDCKLMKLYLRVAFLFKDPPYAQT